MVPYTACRCRLPGSAPDKGGDLDVDDLPFPVDRRAQRWRHVFFIAEQCLEPAYGGADIDVFECQNASPVEV